LANDYEVSVDGKIYMFSNGIEYKVPTKAGPSVVVGVSAAKHKLFKNNLFSFDYPTEMILEEQNFYGIKQITVSDSDASVFMAQIFPAATPIKRLESELINSIAQEFSNLGATFPRKKIVKAQRSIGGKVRSGSKLSYSLGSIKGESEIYTMTRNGRPITLLFQCAIEDKKKASPRFSTIANSFKH
jgi:hypothetical protein